MNERNCLQKIRNLGVRLQSYTTAALDFLFREHQVERPAGAPLDYTLQMLGKALLIKNQLDVKRLDANSVVDYFCRYYRVH